MTIGEALAAFDADEVAAMAVTPRTAYLRTLHVLAFWLERRQRSVDDALATLRPADLEAFVHFHASSSLADDERGSRKAALHVARLGSWLGERAGRPDLDLGRDRLTAVVTGRSG